jgi:hypothetical protein
LPLDLQFCQAFVVKELEPGKHAAGSLDQSVDELPLDSLTEQFRQAFAVRELQPGSKHVAGTFDQFAESPHTLDLHFR